MKSRKFTILFFIAIIVATVFFTFRESFKMTPETANVETSEDTDSSNLSALMEDAKSEFQDPSVSEETQKAVTPEFLLWFRTEIVKTESQNLDPEKLEIELKEKALALNQFELQFLKEKILSESADAREKILSVYVLSLADKNAISSLIDVTLAPLQFTEPQPAHSPEEALSMQEKSLRRLAIESLIESAQNDPELRKSLQQDFSKISDPALRKFALDRLNQLQ